MRGEFFTNQISSQSDRQIFYKDKSGLDRYEDTLVNMARMRLFQIRGLKASLEPTENQVLEAVLQRAKDSGVVTLPPELQDKGWFEILEADPHIYQVNYLKQIPELLPQYRPTRDGKPIPRIFFVPRDYRDASFEDFEVLCRGHEITWTLLTNFGPNPPKGLYLWGGYGTGKTHLISAFARGLQAELTAGYLNRIANFAGGTIKEYEQVWKGERQPHSDAQEQAKAQADQLEKEQESIKNAHLQSLGIETEHPTRSQGNWDKHWEASKKFEKEDETYKRKEEEKARLIREATTHKTEIENIEEALRAIAPAYLRRSRKAYPYQPTDLAFATFDYLFDRAQEEDFIADFLGRRVVIVDDIHPKSNRLRMDFIQRIIEYRYNEVRTGATFITSNLSPQELLLEQGYPEAVAGRIHSRLAEMCMPVRFETDDYRLKKASAADEALLKLVDQLRRDN